MIHIVTLADGASWSYDPKLFSAAPDSIEIRTTKGAEGLSLDVDGIDGCELLKNGQTLSAAPSKALTANETRPVTVVGPRGGLSVRVSKEEK